MFVYLISQHRSGPVKIGIANDVEKRRKILQTANPYHLTILSKIKFRDYMSAYYVEVAMHKEFSALSQKLIGEWFLISAEDALEIFEMNLAWFDCHFNDLGWHPKSPDTWKDYIQ